MKLGYIFYIFYIICRIIIKLEMISSGSATNDKQVFFSPYNKIIHNQILVVIHSTKRKYQERSNILSKGKAEGVVCCQSQESALPKLFWYSGGQVFRGSRCCFQRM